MSIILPSPPMASVGAVTSRLVRLPPDQQASKVFFCLWEHLCEQVQFFRCTAKKVQEHSFKYWEQVYSKTNVNAQEECLPRLLLCNMGLNSRGTEYVYNEYNKRISYGSTIIVASICILFIFIACCLPHL